MHTSISARARTIYERVESLRGRRFPPIDRIDDKAIAALSAWARAFAPGNPDALAARLAWDGLTPALVVAALDAPADEVAPAWTAWLDAFADAARMQAAALRTSKVETFDVAYGEIWSAVVCAAHARIDPKLPALDRQLMRELSALGDLAIDEAFSRYLEGVGIDRRTLTADSSAHYRAFVLSALDGGLMDLWHAYPVLAHQTAIVAGGWIDATTELLQRVDADRSRIGDVLNGGVDPGPIVDVEPGLSDAHDGRRRVAVLHFANGLRVVYKPRDVEIERAFGTLADWLRACGFDPFIRVSRVVSGNGYGWVEYAAHEAFDHASEAREYFRCAGALIFFTHLLGSRDLHMENVVATRSGPVVVDLELLLQPELRGAAEGDADQSCLRTGLLSLIEVGPGDEVFDVGGLRGSGRVPLAAARRTWRSGGTDAIAYVDETVAQAAVKNTVVLNGLPQTPDRWRAEIVDGFERAYRFTLRSRTDWLLPGGPLDAFRRARVRVIARPTNQYALLTTVQSAPRYLRDGAVRSMLVDVLVRPLAAAQTRPGEWPLVVEERRANDAIDVPRFVVPADGRTLHSAGRPILDDYFARSPLDAVRERLAGLSEHDLERQRRALDRALTDSIDSRFATSFESGAEDFGGAAEWIGSELRSHSLSAHGDNAHDLYSGSTGTAVFLSALAAATGSPSWRRMADAALMPSVAWAEAASPARDMGIGACAGIGSIVYGLTTSAVLLGDERALAAATRAAALIDRDRVAADRTYDIVDGAAGAIVGLLALHDVTGEAPLLDTARACGDHLLAARRETPSGWVWPSGDGRRLVGFGHGAAGIGAALSRLADAVSCEGYRNAAAQAFAFVSANFSAADAGWPVAESDAADISTTIIRMSAWCHGAPGISLAVRSGQAREALERLPEWAPNQADHVCCGHMGRVDVLLSAGPALGVADAVPRARAIAARVLARARARQHFRLSTPGFEYRIFDPGFFRGLSGIGYGFLRLANSERFPSVVAFSAPTRAAAAAPTRRG